MKKSREYRLERIKLDLKESELAWNRRPIFFGLIGHLNREYLGYPDCDFEYIVNNCKSDGSFYGMNNIYGGKVLTFIYNDGKGNEKKFSPEEFVKIGRALEIKETSVFKSMAN